MSQEIIIVADEEFKASCQSQYQELELTLQVAKAKDTFYKGEIIHSIAQHLDTTNGMFEGKSYSTAHKLAKVILGITEKHSAELLLAYKQYKIYFAYAEQTNQVLTLDNSSASQLKAIPKDTEPKLAIQLLAMSDTVKEIKENLSKLRFDAKTKAEQDKLKQLEIDKEKEANAKLAKETAKKQQELKDKQKQEREAREEKQRELDEEHEQILLEWIASHEAEHDNLRRAKTPQQIEIDDLLFDIDNDLFKPTNPKLTKALDYFKNGWDAIDSVAELEEEEIVRLHELMLAQQRVYIEAMQYTKEINSIVDGLGSLNEIFEDDILITAQ